MSSIALCVVTCLAGCEETKTETSASASETPTTTETPEVVTIATNPAGARILMDGAELGTAPFEFKFRRKTELQVELDGHKPSTLTVEPGGDPTRVVTLEKLDEEELAAAEEEKAKTARADRRKRGVPGGPAPVKKRTGVGGFLDRTTDKVGGVVGVDGTGARRERRAKMARSGLRYKSVASAKRARSAGKLSRGEYDDTIWVLKNYRKRKREQARKDYNAGKLSKSAYDARLRTIDRAYKGS